VNQDLSVKVLKATDMGRDGEFVFLLPWMKNDEWGEEEWRLGLGLEEGRERVGRECGDLERILADVMV
jgi:hypothetical protein